MGKYISVSFFMGIFSFFLRHFYGHGICRVFCRVFVGFP